MTGKPSETPYLHVRPPKRVVGVGGEGDPVAKVYDNRAGLLALKEQVEAALRAEEGLASMAPYRETDECRYDLVVMRATSQDAAELSRTP